MQLIHPVTQVDPQSQFSLSLSESIAAGNYEGSSCCVCEFTAAVLSSTAVKLPCSVQSSHTIASFSMTAFSHLYNIHSNILVCKGLFKNHLSIKGVLVKLVGKEIKGCIFHNKRLHENHWEDKHRQQCNGLEEVLFLVLSFPPSRFPVWTGDSSRVYCR